MNLLKNYLDTQNPVWDDASTVKQKLETNLIMKHTATPWKFDSEWALITGPNDEEICAVHAAQGPGERRANRSTAQANAAFIVQAVNAHEKLLEALKGCVEIMQRSFPNGLPVQQGTLCEEQDWNTSITQARAALAKTQGVDK